MFAAVAGPAGTVAEAEMKERFALRALWRPWAAAWMALAAASCDVNQSGLESARSVSPAPASGQQPLPGALPESGSAPATSPVPPPSPAPPPSIDPLPPAAPPAAVAPPAPVDPVGAPPPPAAPGADPADCALVDPSVRVTTMRNISPSGDLAFDHQGYLLLVDGRDIARMAKGQDAVPFIENALLPGRSLFGMCVGADGSVYFTDSRSDNLFRVQAGGGRRSFTLDRPIQMVQGPSGNLYVTTVGGEILSLDPRTGRIVVEGRFPLNLRGLAFSPDYQTLYVADRDGRSLRSFEVGPDGSLGPARMFARGLGPGLDGITVDACGNVYLADRTGAPLLRVTPAGRIETVTNISGSLSALAFGSGRQGWDARSLYAVSELRGGLYEIKLDVPGAPPLPPID
jgi:sugar lactone lactonase YvrE